MELLAHTRIKYPRDVVFPAIRDKLPELAPHMPNVKSIVVVERHDEPPIVRFVNIWTAATEIPAVAQRYVSPDLLKWTDRASWDSTSYSCDWKIETHAWPGVVECSGRNTYTVVGDETQLDIRGNLELHIEKASVPRLLAGTVRPIIERIIVTSMRPNLVSIGDAVSLYLQAQEKR